MTITATATQTTLTNESQIKSITLDDGEVINFNNSDGTLESLNDTLTMSISDAGMINPYFSALWSVESGTATLSATDTKTVDVDSDTVGTVQLGLVINDGAANSSKVLHDIVFSAAVVSTNKSKGHILKYMLSVPVLKINALNRKNNMLHWQTKKDPEDIELYSIEIDEDWLIGRSITSASLTAGTSTGLTIDNITIDRNFITARIRNGNVGTHKIEVEVVSDGRERNFDAYLIVSD